MKTDEEIEAAVAAMRRGDPARDRLPFAGGTIRRNDLDAIVRSMAPVRRGSKVIDGVPILRRPAATR